MESLTTTLVFSIIAAWILNAILLMIVGRLNIGLKVNSFLYALVGAAAIAVVAAVVGWVLAAVGLSGTNLSLVGLLVGLLLNALILYIAAKITPGFEILNYVSAIVVAIVLAVIWWLVGWLASLFL
jgi:putative membrane protein